MTIQTDWGAIYLEEKLSGRYEVVKSKLVLLADEDLEMLLKAPKQLINGP